FKEINGGKIKALSKAFAALRQQNEISRQDIYINQFGADRRVNRNSTGLLTSCGIRNRSCCIAQKRFVQLCGLFRGKRWNETRFYLSCLRYFGHYCQSAAFVRIFIRNSWIKVTERFHPLAR